MAHGYGPVADFAARFATAWTASQGNVWVNRYGYLADAKLDAMGSSVRTARRAGGRALAPPGRPKAGGGAAGTTRGLRPRGRAEGPPLRMRTDRGKRGKRGDRRDETTAN